MNKQVETIRAEIERKQRIARYQWRPQSEQLCQELLDWLDTLPEQPDKETILRICKLHKAWSIMAPWENVEDFVMNNWKAENIV